MHADGCCMFVCLFVSARGVVCNHNLFSVFRNTMPCMVCRLILLSITEVGTVLVWAYILAQNWDVYAPGFRILSHNEEYVESETEFDLNPKETAADALRISTIEPVRLSAGSMLGFFMLYTESPLPVRPLLFYCWLRIPGYDSIVWCPIAFIAKDSPVVVTDRVPVAADALPHSAS